MSHIPEVADRPDLATRLERLWAPVTHFDEVTLSRDLDCLVDDLGVEDAVVDVVLPFLREVGMRWKGGRASVAHEHFASQLLRRRLSALLEEPVRSAGPLAVLACPSTERHDLGLLCFAVLLGRAGWRVRYLGAETPIAAVSLACRIAGADVAVLSATRPSALEANGDQVRTLAETVPVMLGGAGATPEVARLLRAGLLSPDMSAAVAELTVVVERPSG